MKTIFCNIDVTSPDASSLSLAFFDQFRAAITVLCEDAEVVGLKSIACYRTGLAIASPATVISDAKVQEGILHALVAYSQTNKIRLAHKELNNRIVHVSLEIAGRYGIPGLSFCSSFCIIHYLGI